MLPNYFRRGTVLAILITAMLVFHLLVSTSLHPLFSWPFPVSLHPQTFQTCIGTSLAISEIAFTHLHYTDFTNGGSEPAITHLYALCFGFCSLQFPEFSEIIKTNVLCLVLTLLKSSLHSSSFCFYTVSLHSSDSTIPFLSRFLTLSFVFFEQRK